MKASFRNLLFVVLVGAAIVLAPHFVYPGFLMKAFCLALFACAFNLLLGYAGVMSFGHAAFFGTGAYAFAFVAKSHQLEPLTAVAVGTITAALLGLAFGLVAIKRHGIGFAMVTLALSQLVFFLALQPPLNQYTQGEDGVQDIPRGMLLGVLDLQDTLTTYYVIAAIVVIAILAIRRIVQSPFGEVLLAIRENEQRATSLGYHTQRYKLIAFVLSAAFSGLAGALKALAFQFAVLADLSWHASGEVVLTSLLGGLGTLAGPIFGGLLLTGIESYSAEINLPAQMVIGIIFVLCVVLFRRGIYGEWIHRRQARLLLEEGRRSPTSQSPPCQHGGAG
ncbi:branched-chain amino acid ABC transporter permease [Cupriavidus necator]|uniref:branched-chain amino acid ABC transporter permease n=1 Tax=Cupriavidus necator TaxID=106590 RepID=UPI0039C3CDF1